MTTQANWQRTGSLVLMTIALLLIVDTQASAQKKDYKPGEKIEYKSSGYPEIWEAAIFDKVTPDGSQPIIRQMPNEFHRDGFQRTASWADIRPLSANPNRVPVDTNQNDNPVNAAGADIGITPEKIKNFGAGLMTQAEVLSFLQTEFGDKPFANPRREELKKELAEMIKVRGLDFRYSTALIDFNNKLGKYGMTSEVIFPLRDNYGEPTKQSWLMGAWNLGKIGAAVDYVKNNRVYRQGEIGVASVGALTLNANGTYVWKSVMAQATSGRWREASKKEMKSKGGDGIVLLKAKSGYDWIVTKDRTTTLKGEWISISELGTRQINEYGSRGGKN
ncbi:MAG TPA: hypothetical protein VMS31_00665 [Pyrinomonadaceae bacterium]|nr:hypothetical protein [Pyrinomonadaceae bacterium]